MMKLPRTMFEFKDYCRRVTAFTASASIVLTPAMSFSIPQGGVVSAGQATIADGVGRVDINQVSDKAVIDWRGFDLKDGETAEFHQPNDRSLTVNRVNSNNASVIDGTIRANGNIMVINPNGMLFSGKADVDVNGLIASTADASNADLMKDGKLSLNKPGNANAAIINQGRIKAKDGGSIGIIAPNISNQGIIQAKLGKVHLASGDTATVDLYGDDLVHAAVSDKVTKQLVENNGIISAQGGSIAITAAAGDKIVDSLINLGGVVDAKSVGNKRGTIKVQADGSNAVKGNRASDKGKKQGSSTVLVSGILDASGKNPSERGGDVTVTGDTTTMKSSANITVSGSFGGGKVKVGGEYQGKGDTAAARSTTIEYGAAVHADALTRGDGGKVIVWSDDKTHFAGDISARGGVAGGDGGFVETSGKHQLITTGKVSASATIGNAGTWLLDPDNITISNAVTNNAGASPSWGAGVGGGNVATADILTALNGGTNVDITATGGITVSNSFTANGYSGTVGLTLAAGKDVVIANGVSISAAGNTRLNTTLRTNTAGAGGAIFMDTGSSINTNGGDITMGGGVGVITAATFNADGSVNTAATGFAVGDSGYYSGITLQNASLDAGGGNIIMNGSGYITNSGYVHGMVLYGGTVQTSGSGNIWLSGTGGGNGANVANNGIYIHSGQIVRTTGTGSLYATGTGGDTSGTGTDNVGVYILSNNGFSATGSGNIVVQGTGGNNSAPAFGGNVGIAVGGNISANGGNITLNGTGGTSGSYNAGINIDHSISTVGSGNISLTGYGTGAGGGGRGIWTGFGPTISTVSGAISFVGDSLVSNGLAFKDITSVVSSSGPITLTSPKDVTFYNSGPARTQLFGGPNYSGNITVRTDTYNNSNTPTFQTTGTVTFAPYTAGANAGLAGGSGMVIDQATMNNITAPTVNIGRTDGTGLLSIGAFSWGSALANLNLYMGGATGNISVTGNVSKAAGGNANLLMKAGGYIDVATGSIISTSGKLNTTLWADSDNSGKGRIGIARAITSNGGNIVLAGGLDDGSNGGTAGDGIPDGYATGDYTGVLYTETGVYFNGTSNLTSGVGDIIIRGKGEQNTTAVNATGIRFHAGSLTSTSGKISVFGYGGSSATAAAGGMGIYQPGTTLSTQSGDINYTAIGMNSLSPQFGSSIDGPSMTSISGNISMVFNCAVAQISCASFANNAVVRSNTGNIDITSNGGDPSNSFRFASGSVIGGGVSSGNITITSDSFNMAGVGTALQTSGTINLKPFTSTTSIGLAGAGGLLNLDATELGFLSAGQLNIGSSTGSGLVTAAANTWNNNTKIYTGTTGITFTGAQNAGTKDFTIDGNINGFYNLDITAGTIGFTGNIGSVTPLNNVTLNAVNSMTLPSINAATIFARTTGTTANITIAPGKTLTATGAGTPLTLAAGGSFINNGGSAALSAASGRWLVFSRDDSGTTGGLASGFIKYGCPYTTPCAYPATGNGFLYAGNPVVVGTPGGGTSVPVLDTTGPNPPITSLAQIPSAPVTPVAVTPSPVIPVITSPVSPPIAIQASDSDFPITVERISIDPTPIITEFTLETSGATQSFANALNELPASESTASPSPVGMVGNDSESRQTSMPSDDRDLSVWDGLVTFSPELVRLLGLDERALD